MRLRFIVLTIAIVYAALAIHFLHRWIETGMTVKYVTVYHNITAAGK